MADGGAVHPSLLATKATFAKGMSAAAATLKSAGRATAAASPRPATPTASSPAASSAATTAAAAAAQKREEETKASLFKVFQYLRKCGPEHPQTNEAIERETKVRIKANADLQARLATHEFIQAVGDLWVFKPKHDIRNKDELREFLRSQYERHPFKGILRQDIERSFAGFDVALKELIAAGEVVSLKGVRAHDAVLFYKDRQLVVQVDDELKEFWRQAKVPKDQLLQQELRSRGIRSAQQQGPADAAARTGSGDESARGAPALKRRRVGRIASVMNSHLTAAMGIDLTRPSQPGP